ncbi:hypothetical protein JCM14469_13370 [Desulfatiferula olefinivorans]
MASLFTGFSGRMWVVSIMIAGTFWTPAFARALPSPGASPPVPSDRPCVPRVHCGPFEGFTLEKVYIDDAGHRLSKDIRFYSSQGDEISKDKIRMGCRVKFVLDRNREVVVMQSE